MQKQSKNIFLFVASKAQGETLIWQFDRCLQSHPVKTHPWIVFTARCNVLMAGDVGDWVVLVQGLAQLAQLLVLGVLKHIAFQAFELDTDRVVVTLGASSVFGLPGVPGSVVGADKLPQAAVSADIKVRGYLQAPDLREVGVGIPIQLVGEQRLHLLAAVLAGGQADGVNDEQIDAGICRPEAKVG